VGGGKSMCLINSTSRNRKMLRGSGYVDLMVTS
jgi:hypothetical protein